jgi:hypothetical protein
LLRAQSPIPAADPVIHVSVNLVQMDAVITDAKGRHSSDVRPGDFEILEGDKPQKITSFSWMEVPPPGQPAASRIPRKEDIRRSIVVLIDDGSMNTQGMEAKPLAASAKNLSEHFQTGNVQPGTNMEPGDYTMQLVADDRLATRKKQWFLGGLS